VFPWAALLMGILSGSIPWYTMMVLHRKSAFFQSEDDTLGVFHTHAVAGTLGGLLSGVFAKPNLLTLMYGPNTRYGPGLIYSFSDGEFRNGLRQIGYQLAGAAFITTWNAVVTSLICILISRIVRLRMNEDELEGGDDAAHGEEAYALWADGDSLPTSRRWHISPRLPSLCGRNV
jgi:Amt family ammonium transporter